MHRTPALALITLALVATPLTMSGCLAGHHHSTKISGAYVQPSHLSRVKAFSSTSADVLQLLGEPTEKHTDDNGRETWTWNWTREEKGSGHLFLIFNGSSSKEVDESVHVTFEYDIAIEKWRD